MDLHLSCSKHHIQDVSSPSNYSKNSCELSWWHSFSLSLSNLGDNNNYYHLDDRQL